MATFVIFRTVHGATELTGWGFVLFLMVLWAAW